MGEADSPIDAYAASREHARRLVGDVMKTADDPAVVAEVVLKAATTRKPKVRYPAGPLARRLSLLKKFAPAAVLDKGIRKTNKLPAPKPGRNRLPDKSSAGVSRRVSQEGLGL